VYAERQQSDLRQPERQITRIDAQLMELLACGVASELARQSQEEESRRHEKRFEQFFSPKLARELNAQPDLLEGRDVDVSVLFCDIRRFSRISESVDTKTVFSFINDVVGVISGCIEKYDGVVVDYVGDAVMGMFALRSLSPTTHHVLPTLLWKCFKNFHDSMPTGSAKSHPILMWTSPSASTLGALGPATVDACPNTNMDHWGIRSILPAEFRESRSTCNRVFLSLVLRPIVLIPHLSIAKSVMLAW
jgi:class 3 adenylate cyclase